MFCSFPRCVFKLCSEIEFDGVLSHYFIFIVYLFLPPLLYSSQGLAGLIVSVLNNIFFNKKNKVSKKENIFGKDLEHIMIKRFLPAGAALVHHLSTVVSRQFAESIITVDDGPVHNLSISQHKVCIFESKYWKDNKGPTTC